MPERPATDPAKPGSKLAEMKALGAAGVARQFERVAEAIMPKRPPPPKAPPIASRVDEAPIPAPPKRKPIEQVRPRQGEPAAVEEAKTAIAAAMAKASLKEDQPWVALGVSRATYFNRKKAGTL